MTDKEQQNTSDFMEDLKTQASLAGECEGECAATSQWSGYEWDQDRQGWFPKVDEDFIAAYQMSYGFTSKEDQEKPVTDLSSNTTTAERHARQPVAVQVGKEQITMSVAQETENTADEKGKKRKPKDDGWFEMEPDKNPNIYISGLPLDITEEEFIDMMSKYGIIMEDAETQKPKIKLYRDAQGNPKGDGRCCYLKMASVNLAIQLLDESEYRKSTLHVEQAEFQMKGSYNPTLKKKKKKKKKKQSKQQEKLLDWVDRDERRPKQERIVVIKNMFDHKLFEKDPRQIISLRNDIKNECEKFGDVRKVIVFDRNPEGICSVAFKEHPAADACLQVMNGRWFAGRRLSADKWDGVSNFKVEETEKDLQDRMMNWEKYLFGEEDEKNTSTSTMKPDLPSSTKS